MADVTADTPTNNHPCQHSPQSRYGPPYEALRIVVRDAPGSTVVELTGELDTATAPMLGSCFITLGEKRPSRLVIDVAALAFCDCSGLNILLIAHHQAAATGGWLRLCGATTHLQKIIQVTRLSQALRCYASVAEAVSAPVTAGPSDAGAARVRRPVMNRVEMRT